MGRRTHGFTLFEVMAAVIVLGLLYSVLATSAIQGLRSEGETRRRMEASLLADRWLAEIEATLASGSLPEIGETEEVEGPYTIRIGVGVLDPAGIVPEPPVDPTQPASGEEETTPRLLAAATANEPGPLRQVRIEVAWDEADSVYSVDRTTFAYDAAAVAAFFPDGGASPEGESEDGGPDSIDVDAMFEALQLSAPQ